MGARMRFREAVESWVARDDPGEASAEAAGHVVPEVCQDAAAEVLKMLCPVCLNISTSYIDIHLRHMHLAVKYVIQIMHLYGIYYHQA